MNITVASENSESQAATDIRKMWEQVDSALEKRGLNNNDNNQQ